MKKSITLITIASLLMLGILNVILAIKSNKNRIVLDVNDSKLAIMVQQEEGTDNYTPWDNETWPTGDYELNTEKSQCDNNSNRNGNISFDSSKGIIIDANKSDKCTIFFDRKVKPSNFAEYIKYLSKGQSTESGGGVLYFHNGNTKNGDTIIDANDYSYRYAGNEPNNYVCLGELDENEKCQDDKDLYRIIGVFPFKGDEQQTSYENGMEYRVKLIKSEYITEKELKGTEGTGDGKELLSVDNRYATNPRVKNTTSINSFYWNSESANGMFGVQDNDWNFSKQTTLNYYLNDYYLNNTLQNWQDKIATSSWRVAGGTNESLSKRPIYEIYKNEIDNNSGDLDEYSTNAKIGLMYISDYGYATSETSVWCDSGTVSQGYISENNRKNNWMYNGVSEWTILRMSDKTLSDVKIFMAFTISFLGHIDNNIVNVANTAVRPTFYLNSNVEYKSGDGSYEHPYKIA